MIYRTLRARRIATHALAAPVLLLGLLAACSQAAEEAPAVDGAPVATRAALEPAPMGTEMSEMPTADSPVDSAMTGDVAVMIATSMEYGDYLVDAETMAFYVFQEDMTDVSTCTGTCAENWPPVIVTSAASSGKGVDAALLSTSTRDDGTMQLTYNGHPLYYYGKDLAPGDTNGHEVGDVWYLVSPAGEAIKEPPG